MTSHSDEIVPQVQQGFQALVADVTGADAQTQTAYTVELTLFRRLLAVGAVLLRRYLCDPRGGAAGRACPDPDGTPLMDMSRGSRPPTRSLGMSAAGATISPAPRAGGPLSAGCGSRAGQRAVHLRAWKRIGTPLGRPMRPIAKARR